MRSLVLSININESIFDISPQRVINSLPETFRKDVLKYKYKRMRWLSYFGKMLLIKGLVMLDRTGLINTPLKYNKYKRPYLTDNLDFNISHSGTKVVCAIACTGKIGVDVQEDNRINDKSHAIFLSKLEQEIAASREEWDLTEAWCKKEAVSKAIGKGLQLNLKEINTLDSPIVTESEAWYLKSIPVTPGYICYMATNLIDNNVSLLKYKLDVDELSELSTKTEIN